MSHYEEDDRPLLIGNKEGALIGQVGGEERPFEPDWTSPPGDTIKDLLEERKLHVMVLAVFLGMTGAEIMLLLRGAKAITPTIAADLEGWLGGTKDFWLRREEHYAAELVRLGQERPT